MAAQGNGERAEPTAEAPIRQVLSRQRIDDARKSLKEAFQDMKGHYEEAAKATSREQREAANGKVDAFYDLYQFLQEELEKSEIPHSSDLEFAANNLAAELAVYQNVMDNDFPWLDIEAEDEFAPPTEVFGPAGEKIGQAAEAAASIAGNVREKFGELSMGVRRLTGMFEGISSTPKRKSEKDAKLASGQDAAQHVAGPRVEDATISVAGSSLKKSARASSRRPPSVTSKKTTSKYPTSRSSAVSILSQKLAEEHEKEVEREKNIQAGEDADETAAIAEMERLLAEKKREKELRREFSEQKIRTLEKLHQDQQQRLNEEEEKDEREECVKMGVGAAEADSHVKEWLEKSKAGGQTPDAAAHPNPFGGLKLTNSRGKLATNKQEKGLP